MTTQQDDQKQISLYASLVSAQADMHDVGKGKENKFGGYSYADLSDYLATCRPILAKYGLGVIQTLGGDIQTPSLTTTLIHKDGGSISDTIRFSVSARKGMALEQSLGASISYIRKYALAAIIGMGAREDLDALDNNDAKVRPAAPSNGKKDPKLQLITPEQAKDIKEIIWSVGADTERFLAYFGIAAIDDLTIEQYSKAISMLEKKQSEEE